MNPFNRGNSFESEFYEAICKEMYIQQFKNGTGNQSTAEETEARIEAVDALRKAINDVATVFYGEENFPPTYESMCNKFKANSESVFRTNKNHIILDIERTLDLLDLDYCEDIILSRYHGMGSELWQKPMVLQALLDALDHAYNFFPMLTTGWSSRPPAVVAQQNESKIGPEEVCEVRAEEFQDDENFPF